MHNYIRGVLKGSTKEVMLTFDESIDHGVFVNNFDSIISIGVFNISSIDRVDVIVRPYKNQDFNNRETVSEDQELIENLLNK